MIGLLGKKVGMTQFFGEDGRQIPVTLLEVGPCYVTDVKNKEKHGYSAVQLGFDVIKEKKLNKPAAGQFKKIKTPFLKEIREFRTKATEGLKVGIELTVENFQVGEYVDVQGVSIGKGYQGVVKRHGFKGGESAHGSKMGRESGSIGQGNTDPGRVPKGRKMAGQMGNVNIMVQNLKIVKIDAKNNVMAVRGAVPGVEGGILMVRTSLTRGSKDSKWKVPSQEGKKETGVKGSEVEQAPADQPPQEAKAEKKSQEEKS